MHDDEPKMDGDAEVSTITQATKCTHEKRAGSAEQGSGRNGDKPGRQRRQQITFFPPPCALLRRRCPPPLGNEKTCVATQRGAPAQGTLAGGRCHRQFPTG